MSTRSKRKWIATRNQSIKEGQFLREVARARLRNLTIPSHPTKEGRRDIEKAGGIEIWIKSDPARWRRYSKYEIAMRPKNPGKVKHGSWPEDLRPSVKGYRRPKQPGGDTIKPPPLTAGMPGNEESDPGPIRDI